MPQVKKEVIGAQFRFLLKGVRFNESQIFTPAALEKMVAPWINREITREDLGELLLKINTQYRQAGYVVCQAVLKAQRIANGVLAITLIEGKTEKVEVQGLKHTREGFVINAFNLTPGEVANYQKMAEDLVRFNMVQDMGLTIDIQPGLAPETTRYVINANEPDNWMVQAFADTSGSRSTGRPKAGLSVVNRSLFGWRDQLSLLGLKSEGSESLLLGYSVPLNSVGTRLSGNVSAGRVNIINGENAAVNVEGKSSMYSLRLSHPFAVKGTQKLEAFLEASRQKSQTSVYGAIDINDSTIDAIALGLDALYLVPNAVYFGNLLVAQTHANESVSALDWNYSLLKMRAGAQHQWTAQWSTSLNLNAQYCLAGDDLVSADFFYLGHTGGVRGYPNDVLSGEHGATVSFETRYDVAPNAIQWYGYYDAGVVGQRKSVNASTLMSLGTGLRLQPFEGAWVDLSVGVPLKKDFVSPEHVSAARVDLMVNVIW